MLLLLAGTGEGRELARRLAAEGRPAVASLAGATRRPAPLALPTRVGGFGGEAGFVRFLEERRISAILDATHPFASRISHRTARVAAARGLPCLQLLRPPWRPGEGDNWVPISREEEAARLIPAGATVFLATGRQRLERFAGLSACRVICRRIDRAEEPFPFAGGEFLVGRPPFSVASEVALFRRLGVEWLVVRNSGGAGGAAKLTAARALGLPVAMLRRPLQPQVRRVASVDEAMDWVRALP